VRERNATLLMATHRAEARASTRRTVWIEDGRIVRDERE
jgi:ABC-type lipoprotein export system ATPase subunit